MNENPPDRWDAGEAYEAFMGRWSRAVAARFVQWLDAEPGLRWLDVGCGTGALTSTICRDAGPRLIVACDPSEPFVEHARRETPDSRVTFAVAGAGSLPNTPGGFDRVVSGLVLNFISEPRQALDEMCERLRPGGRVAAYVWDYAGGMGFLRTFWDEAAALDPAAQPLDEGARFPLCRREPLEALFASAKLQNVRCEPIDVPTHFDAFEDYWRPFLARTGPAPAYVASLSEGAREQLRARLEERLGGSAGQGIALTARAWAIRGDTPPLSPRG